MRRCHQCGTEWVSERQEPGPKEYCDVCSAYLHSCLNCRFHERGRPNDCTVPNSDWVGDRKGPNFCEHFEFRESDDTPPLEEDAEISSAFRALFGDIETPRDEKPMSFEDLFDGD